VTVTRRGNGGPRRHGNVIAYRRPTLDGEVGLLRGIPITSPERTLLDLACVLTRKRLARALRTAIRLEHTSLLRLIEYLLPKARRRGARRLLAAASRYAGLPLERARSGAEVEALIVFRDAGYEVPVLNRKIAGEEADLRWPRLKIIVEVDGGPFHLDKGEDARKQSIWEQAGHEVRRIPADHVNSQPERLLALVPEAGRADASSIVPLT
jgi:hypothetical protein